MSDDGYYSVLQSANMEKLLTAILTEIDKQKEIEGQNQGEIAFALINAIVVLSNSYNNIDAFSEFENICKKWLTISFNEMRVLKFDKT